MPIDVSDEDWAERSQASLDPVRVGRIVVVTPDKAPGDSARDAGATPASGVVTIVIQPSMGFGTGHHASTRLCLALLQRVPIEGARVLDVGTGSGVLAIAAWRLGAAGVLALDHDPDAIASARENVAQNGAARAVILQEADLTRPADAAAPTGAIGGAPVDLLLANLTGHLLARHAATLAGMIAAPGRIIVSGLEEDEEQMVTRAFKDAGLTGVDRAGEDNWVGLLFARAVTSPIGSRAS
jgi:ribosomal protein L11 methyltransferase